jgi:hypothetical protein
VPYLLRKIQRAKWYPEEPLSWLPEGEIQVDALKDFSTTSNCFSLWLIDEDQTYIHRIVAAMALQGSSLANFDYVLIDEASFAEIGINISVSRGNTADDFANHTWHRDAVEVTVRKLVRLAELVLELSGTELCQRVPQKKVVEWVAQAIESQNIELHKLNSEIRENALAKIRRLRG